MNSILFYALAFTILMIVAHIFIFWWFVARNRDEDSQQKPDSGKGTDTD